MCRVNRTQLTTLYVLLVYRDVHVPVRPALLVPASQGVEHFVEHHPFLLAPVADGDVLGASDSTNE